ncbi:MAG: sodium:proton antiporter [Hyphomicrobiales bacterium]|nr:MAG: sodium:proton antiporter [Hyphomicrobiales bacterium]
MPHSTPLISTIVAGLVLAFILGAIANRFRMPPLVGYLVAGVLVGPFTPGFVADAELANELSEIGVILLMFGVGLHFSLKDLLSVRAVAIPGAIVQIGGATIMGLGLATLLGWGLGAGLIFGLALSVASTVVLLKALQDRHMVDSERGRIAVGWLIVEDLAMVLALVLIPAIASINGVEGAALHDPFVDFVENIFGIQLDIFGILAVTVVKLAAFVGFMLVVGRRVIPFILHYTAHTGSRELFRLAVLAIALGVAAGAAYLFGVSLALGAFFAGMILSESELSHRAAQESLPLRDAFAVLFFVAVGMLFDPMILVTDPLPVLGTVFIIIFGKSVLAFLIVVAFKRPVGTALTISASLAQIGEFSFILAALGVGLGILPVEGRDLILAGSIISIILNPVIFFVLDMLRPTLESRFGRPEVVAAAAERTEPDLVASAPRAVAPEVPQETEPTQVPTGQSDHVIIVGFGRVGSVVGEALLEAKTPFLVVEDAEGRANAARALGIEVVVGNAAASKVLTLANVAEATTVVIAIPNAFEAGQAVEQARKQNAKVLIVARAHSDEEETHLKTLGADVVILGEREIGLGMVDVISRDSKAVAEITASDAVEAVLAPLAAAVAATPKLPSDPNLLAEAIEAAQAEAQHVDSGPAEPPALVSAYGEEPDEITEPPFEPDPEALEAEEIAELEALDAPVEDVPPPVAPTAPEPAVPRPDRPATTPGIPFNPEVPPPVPEAEKA